MHLHRRAFVLLSAATVALPPAVRGQGVQPVVVARCGGEADIRGACRTAIEQGADFLQAGIAISRDGQLVARNDSALSAGTDVGARPEFADRKVSRRIADADQNDWFVENFTLAELRSLLPPGPARGAKTTPIVALDEFMALARDGSVRTGRVIGLYLSVDDPAYFDRVGLSMEKPLAQAIRANGYNAAAAALLVESPDAAWLTRFGVLSRVRRVQALGAAAGQGDVPPLDDTALADIRAHAVAIAPRAARLAGDPALPARARAAGLGVYAWSDERDRRRLEDLFALGVRGVATRYAGVAAKARDRVAARAGAAGGG